MSPVSRWIIVTLSLATLAFAVRSMDSVQACSGSSCDETGEARLADQKKTPTPTPRTRATATPTPRPRRAATPTPVTEPPAEPAAETALEAEAAPATLFAAPAPPPAPFAFDEHDCGPPAEAIPGPPPRLIVVGRPMSNSWLMCYIKQDFQGQDFHFKSWGEIRETSFVGYPVECWNVEADQLFGGRRTDGIVAQVYGTNRGEEQFVRFTYRIQLDGDYINNCRQEILAQPEGE